MPLQLHNYIGMLFLIITLKTQNRTEIRLKFQQFPRVMLILYVCHLNRSFCLVFCQQLLWSCVRCSTSCVCVVLCLVTLSLRTWLKGTEENIYSALGGFVGSHHVGGYSCNGHSNNANVNKK